jgi:hypothetical protein
VETPLVEGERLLRSTPLFPHRPWLTGLRCVGVAAVRGSGRGSVVLAISAMSGWMIFIMAWAQRGEGSVAFRHCSALGNWGRAAAGVAGATVDTLGCEHLQKGEWREVREEK